MSDLVTYALLASIFVVMGLRMFFEKPNKLHDIPLLRWRRAVPIKRDGTGRRIRNHP